MRTFLLVLSAAVATTACTASGGFSLHGGGSSNAGTSSGTSSGGTGPSSSGGDRPTASHAVISDATSAAITANGHAFDVNKDCYGDHGRLDFHRTPILYWPCFDYAELPGTAEYSQFARDCDEINEAFKGDASISCQLDHKGFDDHFAAQAKKPHQIDRDTRDPGSYCGDLFTEFAGRGAGNADTLAMLVKPDVRGEFLAKTKSITCAYDDQKGGTVELVGTNLTLYTSQTASGGWVFSAIRRIKVYPALEAFVQEFGACSSGFSC